MKTNTKMGHPQPINNPKFFILIREIFENRTGRGDLAEFFECQPSRITQMIDSIKPIVRKTVHKRSRGLKQKYELDWNGFARYFINEYLRPQLNKEYNLLCDSLQPILTEGLKQTYARYIRLFVENLFRETIENYSIKDMLDDIAKGLASYDKEAHQFSDELFIDLKREEVLLQLASLATLCKGALIPQSAFGSNAQRSLMGFKQEFSDSVDLDKFLDLLDAYE